MTTPKPELIDSLLSTILNILGIKKQPAGPSSATSVKSSESQPDASLAVSSWPQPTSSRQPSQEPSKLALGIKTPKPAVDTSKIAAALKPRKPQKTQGLTKTVRKRKRTKKKATTQKNTQPAQTGTVIKLGSKNKVTITRESTPAPVAAAAPKEEPTLKDIEEQIRQVQGTIKSLERDFFKHLISQDEFTRRAAELRLRLHELEEKRKTAQSKPIPKSTPAPQMAQAPMPSMYPAAPYGPVMGYVPVAPNKKHKKKNKPIILPQAPVKAPVRPTPTAPKPALAPAMPKPQPKPPPAPVAPPVPKPIVEKPLPKEPPKKPVEPIAPEKTKAPELEKILPETEKPVEETPASEPEPEKQLPHVEKPNFAGRDLEAELHVAQMQATRGKERERMEIEDLKTALNEKLKGKVDEEQLRKLTDNVQKLLEAHAIEKKQIEDKLETMDSSRLLESFMALVRLIEAQNPKTETIRTVPEELREFTDNRKKTQVQVHQKELENKELVTDYDKILETVRKTGKISLEKLQKSISMDKKTTQEILQVLEKEDLIDISYPPFGSPIITDTAELRRKEAEK